jgi:hypothetical protein
MPGDDSAGETQLRAMMVVAFSDPANNWMEAASNLLGESETAYFSTLRFAGRQRSYLLGRYAISVSPSSPSIR